MRICVFGAGAVGSHIAVRMALAGHDVSLRDARPASRRGQGQRPDAAVRRCRVQGPGQTTSDDPAALGPQDVVISTLKATAVPGLATRLSPLLRDDTSVVFAQNGIPARHGHPHLPSNIRRCRTSAFSIPAGGCLGARLSRVTIIGGVIFSSNEIVAPGVAANLSPWNATGS